MDSQFSLFSLSHTATPKNTHTWTSKALTSTSPAGDDGDAGDDDPDVGDVVDVDGQNEEAAMAYCEGETSFFAKEDERTRGGLEAESGEIQIPSQSNGVGVDKGGILAEKYGEICSESSSLELGFSADIEYERSHEEDESTRVNTGDLAMIEDDLLLIEVGDGVGKNKDSILTGDNTDVSRHHKLGFGGAFSSSFHGGRTAPQFPMAEFLLLANVVVDDGDETSKKALIELKQKWEAKYGEDPSRRQFFFFGKSKFH
ncbi:UNVERIFIED_CONTAM: hypothetical protein Sindi_0942600 [Sesamum indicum]